MVRMLPGATSTHYRQVLELAYYEGLSHQKLLNN
jgi:hypothetical protein